MDYYAKLRIPKKEFENAVRSPVDSIKHYEAEFGDGLRMVIAYICLGETKVAEGALISSDKDRDKLAEAERESELRWISKCGKDRYILDIIPIEPNGKIRDVKFTIYSNDAAELGPFLSGKEKQWQQCPETAITYSEPVKDGEVIPEDGGCRIMPDSGKTVQMRICCPDFYEDDDAYSWIEYWLFDSPETEKKSREFIEMEDGSFGARLMRSEVRNLENSFSFLDDDGTEYRISTVVSENKIHRAIISLTKETAELIESFASGAKKQDEDMSVDNPMTFSKKFDDGLIAQLRVTIDEDREGFEEYYEAYPEDAPSWDDRYSEIEYWVFWSEEGEKESRQYADICDGEFDGEDVTGDGNDLSGASFETENGDRYEIVISVE